MLIIWLRSLPYSSGARIQVDKGHRPEGPAYALFLKSACCPLICSAPISLKLFNAAPSRWGKKWHRWPTKQSCKPRHRNESAAVFDFVFLLHRFRTVVVNRYWSMVSFCTHFPPLKHSSTGSWQTSASHSVLWLCPCRSHRSRKVLEEFQTFFRHSNVLPQSHRIPIWTHPCHNSLLRELWRTSEFMSLCNVCLMLNSVMIQR